MSPRRVTVVVPDLFFATRIATTAAQLGIALETPAPGAALAAIAAHPPDLVILDLQSAGDPLGLTRALKADPATRAIPVVGFYPHVEAALREAAQAAGVDLVLPRSAFTARLAALLAGPPGPPGEVGTPA
ncbi:MAG: response regulator [Candidatus Eisenbacteria bacterium]|uniref:Response regulator n=1 Tax=Eiseniibacteriota bacterium TaxID=2212470 RepID=A0A538UER7_UNCEI|nr:MAG: response regulator [Candidatus Eisenbacteria bacterium]